ncbi:MAG: sigma-70 family RNA polymerase sigma factor [Fimbriimonadaceae bacterium]|nr:sigma-70 family RNA polymerase sigma factor [Chitinophagales bacterium]
MKLFNFKSSEDTPDEILLSNFKRTGDSAVLGEMFKRYAHLVFGVCMKYLKDPDSAQDMVMQIFEKLLLDLKKHEVNNFKAWLYMVSKNECLMLLRKEKTHMHVEFQKFNDKDEDGMETEPLVHQEDTELKEAQLLHLEDGIKILNAQQKICIELFYMQNKSYEEVSEITGYSMLQVKSYIQNGKRNLKIYLENKNAG